jgi:hypothetical protein
MSAGCQPNFQAFLATWVLQKLMIVLRFYTLLNVPSTEMNVRAMVCVRFVYIFGSDHFQRLIK